MPATLKIFREWSLSSVTKTADDWSNYWRGRVGEQTGAALVGAGIEHDVELSAFWQSLFASAELSARVLDLACGAGSALKHAAAAGLADITGADISADALKSLKSAVPNARIHECSASDTKLNDASFDIIVSQFGIEYAGLPEAVTEIARLLAPGGVFAAIIHMTGGGIAQEVAGKLKTGEAINETRFIPLARDVFTTALQRRSPENDARAKQAAEAFRPAEKALAKIASESGGLAGHLYQGAQQMYGRIANFALPDILGWLDAMQAENDAHVGRMASMIEAAATEAEAETALAILQQAGCETEPLKRFELGGKDAAWVLRATKA